MRKRKVKVDEGVCKLTLKKGKFVASHILPRALTILSPTGERAIQAKLGAKPVKRFQGWYDNTLAIREGEDVLSDIDNKAIKILRQNKLVWSGWPTIADKLPCDPSQITRGDENIAFRIIPNINFTPLKIFFMSILWRAAASSRDDMNEVYLDADNLEKLRLATLHQDPLSKYEFPVRLHQIANRGIPHNRSPFIETREYDMGPPFVNRDYTTCRIYMDGLIAHIALDADRNYVDSLGDLIVGNSSQQGILLNSFESSRSKENLFLAFNLTDISPKAKRNDF